jgi:hypothetical protein
MLKVAVLRARVQSRRVKIKDEKKELAAKVEEKDSKDDGVWMVTVSGDDVVQDWINKCGGGTNCEYKMWTKEEIISGDGDLVEEICSVEINYSPSIMDISNNDIFSYIDNYDGSSATKSGWSESIPDLKSIPDLTVVNEDVDEVEVDEGLVDKLAIDDGDEPMTHLFAATMLANIGSTLEMELYDSGASHHMSPYKHKFINFILI